MKCTIKWINCSGKDTADTNDAVGYAVLGDKRFPICVDHKRTLDSDAVHHGDCQHQTGTAPWTFEPLTEEK